MKRNCRNCKKNENKKRKRDWGETGNLQGEKDSVSRIRRKLEDLGRSRHKNGDGISWQCRSERWWRSWNKSENMEKMIGNT